MTLTYFSSPSTTANAQALRRAVDAAGGLITCAGIARRWGISRAGAHQLTRLPDFPAPVAKLGRSPVYIVSEVDAWRAARS